MRAEGLEQRNKEALGFVYPGLPLSLQTPGHTWVSEACSGSLMDPRLRGRGREGTQTNQPHWGPGRRKQDSTGPPVMCDARARMDRTQGPELALFRIQERLGASGPRGLRAGPRTQAFGLSSQA